MCLHVYVIDLQKKRIFLPKLEERIKFFPLKNVKEENPTILAAGSSKKIIFFVDTYNNVVKKALVVVFENKDNTIYD